MTNPITAFVQDIRCRMGLCDASTVDDNPTIVKMRQMNDELDQKIIDRFGRDFLENLILQREHELRERRNGIRR
jgi:hypothetical protein